MKSLEDKKKELEQKYYLYQFLKEQLDSLNNQAEAMRAAILETQASINAVQELLGGEKTTLIPLGAGTFVEGKIEKVNKVVISIGSDVLVNEDSASAKVKLEQRLNEMESAYNNLLSDTASVTAQIQSILPDVERLAGELNYSDKK
ncbi:MAG: prefoldin subunit alpha [Candidatus Aenigmatarchaeota archaeon]